MFDCAQLIEVARLAQANPRYRRRHGATAAKKRRMHCRPLPKSEPNVSHNSGTQGFRPQKPQAASDME